MDTITDIVIPINDFLLEADAVSGGLYICKSGGAGLLAKSANKDNTYVIAKFFNYLLPVQPKEKYEKKYYYDELELPPIMLDYLLNNDTPSNILSKIKAHINESAKWMDRRGILALVEMTFDPAISFGYRKVNPQIKSLIDILSKRYKIHILDNCDPHTHSNLSKIVNVNGNISMSHHTKQIKCSGGNNYEVYSHFITQHKLNMENVLFIETLGGYMDAIKKYSVFRGIDTNILHYDKFNYECFLINLSSILNIKIRENGIETKKSINQAEMLSKIYIDPNILELRQGSAIIDNFVYNGKIYEKLIRDNGEIICTVMYSDKGHDNNERTIMLLIPESKYDQIFSLK